MFAKREGAQITPVPENCRQRKGGEAGEVRKRSEEMGVATWIADCHKQ